MTTIAKDVTVNFASIDNRIGILETLCAECGALITKVAICHQRSANTSATNQVIGDTPYMASVRRHAKSTLLPI